jgi:hypothetical protein
MLTFVLVKKKLDVYSGLQYINLRNNNQIYRSRIYSVRIYSLC